MSRSPIKLRFEVLVAAEAAQVWARVSTMPGVNAELMPILRMTYPAALSNLDAAPQELLGKLAFKSWVLLLGVLPIDRHSLSLEAVMPGEGFNERSSSWSQRVWIYAHRPWRAPLRGRLRRVQMRSRRICHRRRDGRIFMHRHWRLQAHFGVADG